MFWNADDHAWEATWQCFTWQLSPGFQPFQPWCQIWERSHHGFSRPAHLPAEFQE
jgi:hypothetical protein